MPESTQAITWQIDNFLAGVHTVGDYRARPVNSLTEAKNAWIDDYGSITKRPGLEPCTQLATHTDIKVHDFGEFYKGTGGTLNGERQMLFWLFDSDVAADDVSTVTDEDISTSATTADVQHFVDVNYENEPEDFSDMAYGLNASGVRSAYCGGISASQPMYKYALVAGTSSSLGDTNSSPPKGIKCLAAAFDRLWGGRIEAQNEVGFLYFSNIGDFDTWDRTVQKIGVHQRRGEQITGISPWKGRLLFIGGEQTLSLLFVGADPNLLDWQLETLSNDIGLASNRSIASVYDDLFFVDHDHQVRSLQQTSAALNAGIRPIVVSDPIRDELRPSKFNDKPSQFINGEFWDDMYVVAGMRGSSSIVWTFNVRHKAWMGPWTLLPSSPTGGGSPIYGMRAILSKEAIDSSITEQEHRLYVIGKDPGSNDVGLHYFRKANTLDQTFNASNLDFEFRIVTRPQDFNAPHQRKIVKWIEIDYGIPTDTFGDSSSFTVEGRKDDEVAWTSLGTVNYNTADRTNTAHIKAKAIGKGHRFQVRISTTDTTTGPRIRSMRFHYLPVPVVDR